uniref:Secreted protein n=1 Tax=Steinernema glaseri TaxID=37863 RepID=A0A1I7Y6T2_9BILA
MLHYFLHLLQHTSCNPCWLHLLHVKSGSPLTASSVGADVQEMVHKMQDVVGEAVEAVSDAIWGRLHAAELLLHVVIVHRLTQVRRQHPLVLPSSCPHSHASLLSRGLHGRGEEVLRVEVVDVGRGRSRRHVGELLHARRVRRRHHHVLLLLLHVGVLPLGDGIRLRAALVVLEVRRQHPLVLVGWLLPQVAHWVVRRHGAVARVHPVHPLRTWRVRVAHLAHLASGV